MLRGFYLTLMAGPTVAVPAPQIITDALSGVQITSRESEQSGFQMTFTLSRGSPLHGEFILYASGAIPLMRVILIVTANRMPRVLMDGVVTDQQLSPGVNGISTLAVTGLDLTAVMDKQEMTGLAHPQTKPENRVSQLLEKYAGLGIVPNVFDSISSDKPSQSDRIPGQKGTDLQYIKKLATDVGYVFYISPGPTPGVSTAYWGPKIRDRVAQPALNIDMDAQTNVESLTFRFDALSKTQPLVRVLDATTGKVKSISVPDFAPLNPQLGLVEPPANRVRYLDYTAKLSEAEAAQAGMVEAAGSVDAVTATGTLDVMRYGNILMPRQLVGVRGAGPAFDGLYYVSSVTHDIKRGQYKQNFSLARNGLVSAVPRVEA